MVLFMEDIRRSPVEVGTLSHYLQGFSTIPGGCLRSLNHQQHDRILGRLSPWEGYHISGAKSCLQRYQDLDTALTSVPRDFKMVALGLG